MYKFIAHYTALNYHHGFCQKNQINDKMEAENKNPFAS